MLVVCAYKWPILCLVVALSNRPQAEMGISVSTKPCSEHTETLHVKVLTNNRKHGNIKDTA
jgi:hypothetical protein